VAWGDGAVTVADRWTYQWGARRRPFVHPLRTPAGHVLTVDAPDDHPWHHGLWFTIKYVNGDNYWEEMAPYGVLRHDGPPAVTSAADGVSVTGRLDWIAPDRETVVLRERRSIHYRRLDDDSYALDLDITLDAEVDCELDRTPFNGEWGGYGGLALRGAPGLVDSTLTVEGEEPGTRLLGVRSRWLHLAGRVDDADVGVLILDAPGNPEHPVPWYGASQAPTYGEGWANFVNAAFLWHGPRTLPAGEPLSFAYRVVVHDGRWSPDRFGTAWDTYRAGFDRP
jgi:hypothetical protein